jgi:hypothetical protein
MARKSSTAHWTSYLSAPARCHRDRDRGHPQCRSQQVLRCWHWASSVWGLAVVAMVEKQRLPNQGHPIGMPASRGHSCNASRFCLLKEDRRPLYQFSPLASPMTPMNFFVWQEPSRERSREFEEHAARQRRRIGLPCHSRRVQRSQAEKSICFMGRYKVGLVLGVL